MTITNPRAIFVLVILTFSTIVFSLNHFAIIALFPFIAPDLGQGISFLGAITASQILGLGLFLIPAGLLATKYGPKLTAFLGILAIGAASLAVGYSSDVNQIIVLRFVVGAGMALFFPSVMVLAAGSLRSGSEGLGVGIMGGANAAGGIVGFVFWTLLSQQIGWRDSIIAGAILALISAATLALQNRNALLTKVVATSRQNSVESFFRLRYLFIDRTLVIIGLILLGSQIGLEQTVAFLPSYLNQDLGIANPAIGGLIASAVLLSILVGAPVVGKSYDKKYLRIEVLIIILAVIIMLGMLLNYLHSLTAAVCSSLMVGFAGGGLFTLLSNIARERAATKHQVSHATMSVNFVHAIALTGVSWAPVLFATGIIEFGYARSWVMMGSIAGTIIISFSILAIKMEYFVKTISKNARQQE